MTDQMQTLINTLIQGGLASSDGEARRMAESMIGTTEKVQNEYSAKKDQNHMFAEQVEANQKDNRPQEHSEIKTEPVREIKIEEQKVQSPQESNAMQSKIEELRNAALNPEPVKIKVDFQTPKTDNYNQGNDVRKAQFSEQDIEKAKNSVNEMPNVDFKIPGFDNNLTINELASENQPAKQENFFSQAQRGNIQSFERKAPEPQTTIKATEPEPIQQNTTSNFGLESGFPSEHRKSQVPTNDFLQMKETPVEAEVQSQNTQSAPANPQKEDRWTPEEKKLRDEVDLSKIFNFSNR